MKSPGTTVEDTKRIRSLTPRVRLPGGMTRRTSSKLLSARKRRPVGGLSGDLQLPLRVRVCAKDRCILKATVFEGGLGKARAGAVSEPRLSYD